MIRRILGLLAAVALAVLLLPMTVATAAEETQPPAATVRLLDLTPRLPDPNNSTQVVKIVAAITNTTNTTFTDVQFGLERGETISQQSLLDQAIANPLTTDQTGFSVPNPLDLHKELLPKATITVTYTTTVADMCFCYHGIYPYALVAKGISDPDQGMVEIGRSQLLLPSLPTKPKPVQTAWIWPLLDRPHRSIYSDTFTDESLAGEISTGGRLDRALQVPELLAGKVRMTLVVDPDLLDSLAVMAGPDGYRVTKGSTTVPGTGGQLARNWLARFKAVETYHDVVLTGYGDPDLNALARAGLSLSSGLDPQVQSRISPYLNGNLSSDLLTWPADEALSARALDALVGNGTSTVLLSDAAIPGHSTDSPPPDALSPLPTAAGTATALVLSHTLETDFKKAIRVGAPNVDGQTFFAQLAIRAEEDPANSHFVVLAPDRYVDADPGKAASVINSVRNADWATSISIPDALHTITPVNRGALNTAVESSTAEISQAQLNQLSNINEMVSSMNEALHDNDAAAELLAGFNTGIQRAESNAWRTDPNGGARVAQLLQDRIDGITQKVHLVTPAVGTYSLSSSNSPIVVTVANDLTRAVTVKIVVNPTDSGVGFTATPEGAVTIPAGTVQTVRIPTHTARLGKFQVRATLETPDGQVLGAPIQLNLRATAIGTVTKIITIVAVAVLVLALLRRFVRWIRRRPTRHAHPVVGAPA